MSKLIDVKSGMRVHWTDPDEDTCSCYGTVDQVEGDTVTVKQDGGGEVEVYAEELEIIAMGKPAYVPPFPYGYTFGAINVVKKDRHEIGELDGICPDHHHHHLSVHESKHHHIDRLIWEVATFIEGNFGPPYQATLFWSREFETLYIMTPENDQWWNSDRWRGLSDFLMGLRSTLDILEAAK